MIRAPAALPALAQARYVAELQSLPGAFAQPRAGACPPDALDCDDVSGPWAFGHRVVAAAALRVVPAPVRWRLQTALVEGEPPRGVTELDPPAEVLVVNDTLGDAAR